MDVLLEKRERSRKLLSKLEVVGQKTADSIQDIYKILLRDQKKLADSKDNCSSISSYNHVRRKGDLTSPGHHDKKKAHAAVAKASISGMNPLCKCSGISPFKVLQSLCDEENECSCNGSNTRNSSSLSISNKELVAAGPMGGGDAMLYGGYVNARDSVHDVASSDSLEDDTDVCGRHCHDDIATGKADGGVIYKYGGDVDVTDCGDSFFIDYIIGGGVVGDDDDGGGVTSRFSLKNSISAQSMSDEHSDIGPSVSDDDEPNYRIPNATSESKYFSLTPKYRKSGLQIITRTNFSEGSAKEEHEPRSPLRILGSDYRGNHWHDGLTNVDNNDDNDFQLSGDDLGDIRKLENSKSNQSKAGAEENQSKSHDEASKSLQEDAVEEEDGRVKTWYVAKLEKHAQANQYPWQLNDSGNQKKPSRMAVGTIRHPENGKENVNRATQRNVRKSQKEKLLGYDWIAGVLDNREHHSATHLSNEYFDELKSFWKEFQDRPLRDVNQLENFVDESREPQLIQDILTESKIKSFHINDRLFSEPIKKKSFLTSESSEINSRSTGESKHTFTSPRYVRITMPQDLLATKHRDIKAPQKGTCDTTDTLSLGKHCVMGWDNTQHGKLATASSISIKHASGGRAKETLTMEEAENLAAGTTSPFQTGRSLRQITRKPAENLFFTPANGGRLRKKNSSTELQTTLRRQSAPVYCDTHRESSSSFLQCVANATSSTPTGVAPSSCHSFGEASTLSTSDLLDSTYSLIRDLDRLRAKFEKKKLVRQQQLDGFIT